MINLIKLKSSFKIESKKKDFFINNTRIGNIYKKRISSFIIMIIYACFQKRFEKRVQKDHFMK